MGYKTLEFPKVVVTGGHSVNNRSRSLACFLRSRIKKRLQTFFRCLRTIKPTVQIARMDARIHTSCTPPSPYARVHVRYCRVDSTHYPTINLSDVDGNSPTVECSLENKPVVDGLVVLCESTCDYDSTTTHLFFHERATLGQFASTEDTAETIRPRDGECNAYVAHEHALHTEPTRSNRVSPAEATSPCNTNGAKRMMTMTMDAYEQVSTPNKETRFEFCVDSRDGNGTRRSSEFIAPFESFIRDSPRMTGKSFAITPDHLHVPESAQNVDMSPSIHATYNELSRGAVVRTPFKNWFNNLTPNNAASLSTPRTPSSIPESHTASASTIVDTQSAKKAYNPSDEKNIHVQRSLFF